MEDREVAARTRRGLGLAAFSDLGHYLVIFIASIVLARLLGPADFGIISVVNGVLLLSFSVGTAGMGQAVVRARSLEKPDLDVAFTLSTGLSTLLMLAILAVARPTADLVGIPAVAEVLPVLALRVVLAGAAAVPMGLLRRRMQFGRLAAIEIGVAMVYGVLGIGLAVGGFGVWSLVWANLAEVSLRVTTLLVLSGYRPALRRPSPEQSRMLHFGGGLTAANLFQFAARSGPRMILASQLGADAAGLYNRADAFSHRPVLRIFQVMQRVLFPAMSHMRRNEASFARWHCRAAGGYALVVAPLVGIVGALAPELVALLLGNAWRDAATPLALLCAGSLASLAFPFVNLLLQARGRVAHLFLKTAVITPLLLAAGYFGTRYGLVGFVAAGVAIVPVQLLAAALCLRISLKLPLEPILAHTLPPMAAGLGAAAAARLCADQLAPGVADTVLGAALLLLASGAAGLLTYAAAVALFAREQVRALLQRAPQAEPAGAAADTGE